MDRIGQEVAPVKPIGRMETLMNGRSWPEISTERENAVSASLRLGPRRRSKGASHPTSNGKRAILARRWIPRFSVPPIALAIATIASLTPMAPAKGEVIGQITAVDHVLGTVTIDGSTFPLARGMTASADPGDERADARRVPHLAPGQVVRFEAEEGSITRITLLPGLSQVPR